MSVNATIGLPGGGKSYSAVEDIILREHKKKFPKTIHTNLPLNLDMLAQLHNVDTSIIRVWDDSEEFANTFTKQGAEHEGYIHDKCLVIWDEIQDFVPNTFSKTPVITGFQAWIAKHRHYGCDFHYISQAYESVHVDARRRTFSFTHCESMEKKLGGKDKFKRTRYGKDPQSHDPHWKFPYKEETVQLKKEIYLCYKSFVHEGSGQTGANGFEVPTFIKKYIAFIVVFLAIIIGLGVYSFQKLDLNYYDKRVKNPTGIAKGKTDGKQIQTKNQIAILHDSITVDGLVCVDASCDLYGGEKYLGTYNVKDTATQKSIRWNVAPKPTGN